MFPLKETIQNQLDILKLQKEQTFCDHKFKKIKWIEKTTKNKSSTYSKRLYKCIICGKEVWQDGRRDKIALNGFERDL